jgi:hypothetical protein
MGGAGLILRSHALQTWVEKAGFAHQVVSFSF